MPAASPKSLLIKLRRWETLKNSLIAIFIFTLLASIVLAYNSNVIKISTLFGGISLIFAVTAVQGKIDKTRNELWREEAYQSCSHFNQLSMPEELEAIDGEVIEGRWSEWSVIRVNGKYYQLDIGGMATQEGLRMFSYWKIIKEILPRRLGDDFRKYLIK